MKIEATSRMNEIVSQLHDGYVINNHEVDQLIGKVLTLIEMLGLEKEQEQSTKDMVKQSIREQLNNHPNNFCGGGVLHAIMLLNQKLHDECIKNPEESVVGMSPRDGEYTVSYVSHHELKNKYSVEDGVIHFKNEQD